MIEASASAIVFPGQGSQYVGMGRSLAERYHVARQTFEEADDILGYPLSTLCWDGPEEALNDTSNAQPALYVAGVAALRTFYELIAQPFEPRFTAGHSLGEFTALTAAAALSFTDGLRLVRQRGLLMKQAGEQQPGGMLALLGVDKPEAEKLCADTSARTGGVIVVANDNCPGQVVISGEEQAIADAAEHAKDVGAKRAVRLPVSTANHSPLMAPAAEAFRQVVADVAFHPPRIPVIGNTTAQPLLSADDIRAEIYEQMTSQVRWTESIQAMQQAGINTYIELGSKDVLSGLIKRIDRSAGTFAVDTPENLEALLAAFSTTATE